MKTFIAAALAAASLSACVTAPTDPAALAAWEAEKTARTEARRPPAGSVVANPKSNPEDFEELKKQTAQPDPFGGSY
jgi:hypothetical protein